MPICTRPCQAKGPKPASVTIVNGPVALVRENANGKALSGTVMFHDNATYLPGSNVPRQTELLTYTDRIVQAISTANEITRRGGNAIMKTYDPENLAATRLETMPERMVKAKACLTSEGLCIRSDDPSWTVGSADELALNVNVADLKAALRSGSECTDIMVKLTSRTEYQQQMPGSTGNTEKEEQEGSGFEPAVTGQRPPPAIIPTEVAQKLGGLGAGVVVVVLGSGLLNQASGLLNQQHARPHPRPQPRPHPRPGSASGSRVGSGLGGLSLARVEDAVRPVYLQIRQDAAAVGVELPTLDDLVERYGPYVKQYAKMLGHIPTEEEAESVARPLYTQLQREAQATGHTLPSLGELERQYLPMVLEALDLRPRQGQGQQHARPHPRPQPRPHPRPGSASGSRENTADVDQEAKQYAELIYQARELAGANFTTTPDSIKYIPALEAQPKKVLLMRSLPELLKVASNSAEGSIASKVHAVVNALRDYQTFLKPSTSGPSTTPGASRLALTLKSLAQEQDKALAMEGLSKGLQKELARAFDTTTTHFFGLSANRPSKVNLHPSAGFDTVAEKVPLR